MTLPLDGRAALVTGAARGQRWARQVDVATAPPCRPPSTRGWRRSAGIAPLMGGSDEDETFADVLDVNLTGNTVKVAAPPMVDAGSGGAIVLISSPQGLFGTGGNDTAGLTAYTASKHGLVGLMRSFANWVARTRSGSTPCTRPGWPTQ